MLTIVLFWVRHEIYDRNLSQMPMNRSERQQQQRYLIGVVELKIYRCLLSWHRPRLILPRGAHHVHASVKIARSGLKAISRIHPIRTCRSMGGSATNNLQITILILEIPNIWWSTGVFILWRFLTSSWYASLEKMQQESIDDGKKRPCCWRQILLPLEMFPALGAPIW